MHAMLSHPAFRSYLLCSTILALYLLALANLTGAIRIKNKVYVNPEDAKSTQGTLVDADHPDVQRIRRAHANAVENVPLFWVIGLFYVLTDASAFGASAYFWTFTASRFLHSLFYLKGIQPFRTMMYGIGTAALVGMSVHVLRALL
jgi:prostaglandin-E synthase 1